MIGRVEAIGKGGRGIVFYEGKPVFLDGVLRGEIIEFTVTKKKHSVSFGTLTKVLESSKERITPPCPYYELCGGCNFQHIAYPEQIALKKDILRNNLKRIAKIDYQHPIDVITSPSSRYRTRSILKVKQGKIGFFKKESHEVVEIETCLLLPQVVEDFLQELREGSTALANFNRLSQGINKGEILILSNGKELSVLLKANRTGKYLSDKKEISFKIGDFSYAFSPDNFIQANLFTLEPMIELVQKNLGKDYFEKAVDLFCGAGFFTLPLAQKAGKVTALEADKKNILSLKDNLDRNVVDNVEIRRADILKSVLPAADLFLIDPPRTGLNKRAVNSITASRPKKIFYFSCDSATFCRDISVFRETGYTMKDLKIFDNFPQTDHFEIYSCLQI